MAAFTCEHDPPWYTCVRTESTLDRTAATYDAESTGLNPRQRQAITAITGEARQIHTCGVRAFADGLKPLIVQRGGTTIQLRGITAELEPRQTHATNRTSADNAHWFAHPLLPITATAQAGAIGTITAIVPMHVCVASFEFYGEFGFRVLWGFAPCGRGSHHNGNDDRSSVAAAYPLDGNASWKTPEDCHA